MDNGTCDVASVVFQRRIVWSVHNDQLTKTWRPVRNHLSLHSLMIIQLRIICLRKGSGSPILPATKLSSDEECSSSSSAFVMLGKSVPRPLGCPFYDDDPPLYRRGTLELGLPQIVAVGSQSVGKSSLIENISGVRHEMSGLKLVSSFRVDNAPSRQWHMHQVSGHCQ